MTPVTDVKLKSPAFHSTFNEVATFFVFALLTISAITRLWRRGDRVLLYMQNSPQFVIGYYAILRADAMVVPVNAMNLAGESAESKRTRIAEDVKKLGADAAIVSLADSICWLLNMRGVR